MKRTPPSNRPRNSLRHRHPIRRQAPPKGSESQTSKANSFVLCCSAVGDTRVGIVSRHLARASHHIVARISPTRSRFPFLEQPCQTPPRVPRRPRRQAAGSHGPCEQTDADAGVPSAASNQCRWRTGASGKPFADAARPGCPRGHARDGRLQLVASAAARVVRRGRSTTTLTPTGGSRRWTPNADVTGWTVFGFFVQPGRHVLFKLNVTRNAAAR